MPLIITHGWPGSVVEFHKVIEPLTDPSAHGGNAIDAFHVICPSLPGFGFSAKPATAGWGVDRIASAWAVLMDRLGYSRYGAQGGDWGSAVTTALGAQDPTHCAGIHITLAMGARPNTEGQPTPEEARALQGLKYYADWDSGYSKQQSTRPQTLGYGLTDSPSGQAAWILEKFWAWTDCDGHPENILGRDELLDNVMLYWVTATAASSARLYWESFGPKRRTAHKVTIPTGVAVFPKEIVTPVRKWMETSYTNIRHWSEMPKGGHFAAFEQPGLFVPEVRGFFRTLASALRIKSAMSVPGSWLDFRKSRLARGEQEATPSREWIAMLALIEGHPNIDVIIFYIARDRGTDRDALPPPSKNGLASDLAGVGSSAGTAAIFIGH